MSTPYERAQHELRAQIAGDEPTQEELTDPGPDAAELVPTVEQLAQMEPEQLLQVLSTLAQRVSSLEVALAFLLEQSGIAAEVQRKVPQAHRPPNRQARRAAQRRGGTL